jgi:murein DD-endopeptidase MepM/ murein hydrolase activator NlpD
MNKLKSFFTTRGFYIALTLGVVAFAVLMGVYEYRENSSKLLGETSVDLNKSYAEGTPTEESKQELDVTSNAAKSDANKATDTDASYKSDSTGTTDSSGSTNAAGSSTSTNTAGSKNTVSNSGSTNSADKSTNSNSASTADRGSSENNETASASAASDGATNIINEDGTQWTGFNGDAELVWPLIGSSGVYGDSATGSVVIPYSMDTTVYFETLGVYRCNPSVMLRGEEGENVYSVYGGTVTSVADTKEFGTVVTVDMGNGYEAVYGQLMNVTVSEGDVIASGQNIAEIGPVSSYYTKEGTHLYLALTKDDVPLNPMTLIE